MPDGCVPQDPHKHSDYPGSTMVIAETGSDGDVEITGKTKIYWFTLERLHLHVAVEYRIMTCDLFIIWVRINKIYHFHI